jgi:flagellar protein FliL
MAEDDKAEKTAKGGISIIGLLLVTLLGVGAGTGFGFVVQGLLESAMRKPSADAAQEPDKHLPPTAVIKTLPTITTNLAQPASTWIRLEAAIVVEKDLGPDGDVIVSEVAEDIVGFVRTLSMDQISGPSGFQHLREDLNDRIRIRSKGKASELIISSLILE